MNSASDIRHLRVTHWSPRGHLPDNAGPGLLVDTCLRQVYIDVSPTAKFHDAQLSGQAMPTERESGPDAYRLLLEITTGLRSAVPGETNVFGQFKDAWAAFRSRRQPAQVARLAPLMHRLINDTKTIRTEYLHGIGGASYGSLVRRLVTPRPEDRILFVGAGNLAQSMLPFFKLFDVGLWNRSAIDRPPENVTHYFRPEQGHHAARWANHVILTTPPDPTNDGLWCEWIGASVRTVVHLGYRSNRDRVTGAFPVARKTQIKTYTLDDVFALRQTQAERRSTQLAHARAACRDRAGRLIPDHCPDNHRLRFGCLNTA
jgi:hypothetical protein